MSYEYTDATLSQSGNRTNGGLTSIRSARGCTSYYRAYILLSRKTLVSRYFRLWELYISLSFCKFTEQVQFFEMSAKCPGELLYTRHRESSLPFLSSRRSRAHWLVIVPFNPSGNSLHSPICSHHLRTSLASCVLQKDILLGHSWLWACSNSQLHLSNHQYQKSEQPRALRSLVCTNSCKSLSTCLRGQKLIQFKIAPLLTNAFVYMVMGESWPLTSQLDNTLIRGALPNYFWRA